MHHWVLLLGVAAALALGMVTGGCGTPSSSPATCVSGTLSENGHRGEQFTHPPAMEIDRHCHYDATIATTKGNIVVRLLPEQAPLAVNNFIFLARHRFYTNILFHRVIKGFMIQTGDPEGNGTGGPGYEFKIEHYENGFTPGTVAMANAGGSASNGSQFFICQGSQCESLSSLRSEGAYFTVFGLVIKGMSVVNGIAGVPKKVNPSDATDGSTPTLPIHPVLMKWVTIQERG